MFSLSVVKQAGQAAHYFAQDNYYATDKGLEESQWFGKAAQTLGLEGRVDQDTFLKLLKGRVDDQQVGRSADAPGEAEKIHRPGTDLTFSAPKSVSILAEVHEVLEVRQAHEKATQKALEYLESRLLSTRVTVDGFTDRVPVQQAVFALFRHNTNRNLDPQTHTHAVLLNLANVEDGKWRSLVNDELFKERALIGAIYNNELAKELKGLGYELKTTDDRGNFEVVGVSAEAIDSFSSRRKEVLGWLKEKGIDPAKATLKETETAALATRAGKGEVDHTQVLAEWKEKLGQINEKLPERKPVVRTGGTGLVELGRSEPGARDMLVFASSHLYEKEMVVSRQDLLKTALQHSNGRAGIDALTVEFEKLVKDGSLVATGEDRFTAKKPLESERWGAEQIQLGKAAFPALYGRAEVAERIRHIEKTAAFPLTPGQRDAITLPMVTQDRFVAIQGLAGSGKTTMLKALNELAIEKGLTVKAMAPTGAATEQLRRETGISADTVALFELKEPRNAKDIAYIKQYSPDFERAPELWVVDEASFLSQRQMSRLEHMAIQANARVVLLGDSAQLQGVEAGKPFEIAQRSGIAMASMNQINRQNTPELKSFVATIVKDAQAATDQGRPLALKHNAEAFDALDRGGHVLEKKPEDLHRSVMDRAFEIRETSQQLPLIITPYNKDRVLLNDLARASLRQAGVLGHEQVVTEIFTKKDMSRAERKEAQYFKPGDVIQSGRDYEPLGIAKGEVLKVHSVEGDTVTLMKGTGESVAWLPKQRSQVEVYGLEKRKISVGDQIRMTRSTGELSNGAELKVVQLTGHLASLEDRVGRRQPHGGRQHEQPQKTRHSHRL